MAPSSMAAPRNLDVHVHLLWERYSRGDNNRLLREESIESCLIEQRCSVDLPCVTFYFVL